MASIIVCRVHPVVLLSIIDAYERRDSKEGSNKKAIGTLLGKLYEINFFIIFNMFL